MMTATTMITIRLTQPLTPAAVVPPAVLKPLTMPLKRLDTIPTKISSEMPLPMPLSVIRSPIHMASAVPAAMHRPIIT